MKIQGRQIQTFINTPDFKLLGALIFGPEEGLVSQYGNDLAKKIVPDTKDPFSSVQLDMSALIERPSLLLDEMTTMSFLGGRKLIRVRFATEKIFPALEILLDSDMKMDHFLIIEAGDLDTKSKLRNHAEKSEKMASIACYEQDIPMLTSVIQEMLRQDGFRADPDILYFLATQLGNNRLMLNLEIDKLKLYMGTEKHIAIDDVRASLSNQLESFLDEPAYAAADGNYAELDMLLSRLFNQTMMPVAILRGAQNHFTRLLQVKTQIEKKVSLDSAIASLRPPLFFKSKPQFTKQLQFWKVGTLQQALELLMEAEQACKMSGMPAETMTSRCFYKIAALAKR